MARLGKSIVVSGWYEASRIAKSGIGALDVAERVANDLLGQAGTFATLGRDTCRFTDITIATATFINGFTDLAVGNALAKTHVHRTTRWVCEWL